MGRESNGFAYQPGDLEKGGKAADVTAQSLTKPLNDFVANAAQTQSCFGLVPQGSEELANDYRTFYTQTVKWVQALQWNLANAAKTLNTSEKNYENGGR